MTWVSSFRRFEFEGKAGKAYDRLRPKKVLIHTTEGSSVESAMRAYAKWPPHIIADYGTNDVVQHLSLDRAGYALKGNESDDEPVIQVELVGKAAATRHWPDEQLKWIAERVLAPIHALWPFELQGPPQGFADELDHIVPFLATPESPLRFLDVEFEAFGGICGHQHAPAPDNHWDPGRLNIDRILVHLQAALEPEPAPQADAGFEAMLGVIALRSRVLAGIAYRTAGPYDFVTALYHEVLDREPDDQGLLHWTAALRERKANPVEVVDAFLEVAAQATAGTPTEVPPS